MCKPLVFRKTVPERRGSAAQPTRRGKTWASWSEPRGRQWSSGSSQRDYVHNVADAMRNHVELVFERVALVVRLRT